MASLEPSHICSILADPDLASLIASGVRVEISLDTRVHPNGVHIPLLELHAPGSTRERDLTGCV